MSAEITEILDRLHACEAGLEVHRGYLKAMEYALRALVLTHQDPDSLLDTWTRLRPSMAHRDGRHAMCGECGSTCCQRATRPAPNELPRVVCKTSPSCKRFAFRGAR